MLTKQEVLDQVRTLTFRVAVKAAQYEEALKPEVWPFRVGVRHYRAPRREKPENNWKGQSERTGGQIDQGSGGHVPAGAYGGGRGNGRQGAGQYLPPGHAGRVGSHPQRMEKQQPGPIELSNFFSVLSALGGGMMSLNQ